MNSNFSFLTDRFPALENMGRLAECYLYSDPNTCIYKMGSLAETIVNYIFELDGLKPPSGNDNTHANRIKILQREKMLPKDIDNILYVLRIKRNVAVHEGYDSLEDCQTLIQMAHTLSVWFMQIYGDDTYEPDNFMLPADISNQTDYQELLENYEKLSAELEYMKAASLSTLVDTSVQAPERRKRADRAAHRLSLSEKESRYLEVEKLYKKWGKVVTVLVCAVPYVTVLAVIETAIIVFSAILANDISIQLMIASIVGAFILVTLFVGILFNQVRRLCFTVCQSYFKNKRRHDYKKSKDGKMESKKLVNEENE
ncbi:MAG: hypothetical protein FWH46_00660 [Methanimicrococcus sp.]|nr:hypothetical protein [Methanimicrococcus sp.]